MFEFVGLTQNVDCWNPFSFVSCVEKMAGIEHVNDLLRLKLDMNQCKYVYFFLCFSKGFKALSFHYSRLMISITTCNVRATTLGGSTRCTPSLEGVNEIIHTFFSKTECGRVCGSYASIVRPEAFALFLSLVTMVLIA